IGKSADECASFTAPLHLTIEKISNVEPHALDAELFGKIYGEGTVADEAAFRAKIQGEAEAAFATETDSQAMNDTVDFLIENTKFDLPLEFLKKWLMVAGEKQMSEEEAAKELENSEKGLRYQLIETEILAENGVRIEYADIVERAKALIRMQMAQYGQVDMKDEDLNPIVERVLKNKEEIGRLQSMIIREKMLAIFKEKVPYKTKEVTLEEFVKAIAKKK
ncbi:MAG: trigger factor, partial [Flavobacteriales bacterium]|nr:trigger factor [Flavobacteriales bacterium]